MFSSGTWEVRKGVASLVGTTKDDRQFIIKLVTRSLHACQEEMAAYTLPEMLRVPLDETVLQIKVHDACMTIA